MCKINFDYKYLTYIFILECIEFINYINIFKIRSYVVIIDHKYCTYL